VDSGCRHGRIFIGIPLSSLLVAFDESESSSQGVAKFKVGGSSSQKWQ